MAAPSFAHAVPRVVIASQSDATRSDATGLDRAASSATGPVGPAVDVSGSAAPTVAHTTVGRTSEDAEVDAAVSCGSTRYSRAARMTTPAEFDRCLRRPALHRSGPFALHLCWVDGASEPAWRLGLVVPKRYEATAVGRNTIKRRWRDAFRRGREQWAGEFGSADLVVRLQTPLVPKVKAAKGPANARKAAIGAVPAPPVQPAKVRARERFDPVLVLDGLVERLRSRGGRPSPGDRGVRSTGDGRSR